MTSSSLVFSVRGDDFSYPVSAKDKLVLTRAVAREGKPYDAVTWALIQRFAWLYPSGAFETLADLVEAYAQPINPKWFPSGAKHKAAVRRARTEAQKEALEDRAERRLDYADATYDEIDEKYKNVVDSILAGNKASPVLGAVHYRASTSDADTETEARRDQLVFAENRTDLKNPVYTSTAKRGTNWFFDVRGSDKLALDILESIPGEIAKLGSQNLTAVVYILTGVAAGKLAEQLKS
jgi:hypothetical protein